MFLVFRHNIILCRVDLGVAAQTPHRPGRAQLTHPVLRAVISPNGLPFVRSNQGFCTSSLYSFLLSPLRFFTFLPERRISGVQYARVHRVFPGVLLPSVGSLRPRFADFSGTMWTLRLPPRHSPVFRLPSHQAYYGRTVHFVVPRLADSCVIRYTCDVGRVVVMPVQPMPAFSAESCGSPKFLCNLLCLRSVLRPRPSGFARSHSALPFCPRLL